MLAHSAGAMQAFKYQSHVFHGRHSGKNKVFKRLKKVMEEKSMERGDGQIRAMEQLQQQQRELGTAAVTIAQGQLNRAVKSLDVAKLSGRERNFLQGKKPKKS
jgi:U4/U6.U5 tri-snRNP-associated protein 1